MKINLRSNGLPFMDGSSALLDAIQGHMPDPASLSLYDRVVGNACGWWRAEILKNDIQATWESAPEYARRTIVDFVLTSIGIEWTPEDLDSANLVALTWQQIVTLAESFGIKSTGTVQVEWVYNEN